MSVGNGDFETPGVGAGEADQWSYSDNCQSVMDGPVFYCTTSPTFTESFEFADGGWPDTIADPFPTPTFATPTFTESFEFAESWPGTAP
jgi:hypothetical protein